MKHALYLLTLAVLTSTTFAKADYPAPNPVSGYMRDTGILYLETVEGLSLDCGLKSPVDDDCMSRWKSTLNGLQDRVDITLGQSKRPSGDKPFWELFKQARYARESYVRAESDHLDKKAWTHAWGVCYAHAHTIALEGKYFNGDGGCGDAISEASK
jgi:hypothetical protein